MSIGTGPRTNGRGRAGLRSYIFCCIKCISSYVSSICGMFRINESDPQLWSPMHSRGPPTAPGHITLCSSSKLSATCAREALLLIMFWLLTHANVCVSQMSWRSDGEFVSEWEVRWPGMFYSVHVLWFNLAFCDSLHIFARFLQVTDKLIPKQPCHT